ncbi:MAG TPA: hypothetical protein VMS43_13850 [Allosphingosinicella sp.]|nr:hypothetical protein [Allosphingosinicella sp.]
MAEHRPILRTCDFGRVFAEARIWCDACGHALFVDQTILNLMFPQPLPLTGALTKLVCSECGEKSVKIEIVRKPPR